MSARGFNLLQWAGVLGAVAVLAVAFCAIRSAGPAKIEGDTPEERIACIRRLARDRPAGTAEAIAAAAGDRHALVRQAALMALDELGDVRHRSAFEVGTGDVAPWTREVAAEALGRFPDDDCVRRLGDLLAKDPTGGVRAAAARALARIATPPAVTLLVEAVAKNSYTPVRLQALAVLEGLLLRHAPEGEAPWETARWNHLKAEVQRVRPMAKIDPVAQANCACGHHEHKHARDDAQTRPGG